ncbi:DUF4349 domain-containing protein [Streptomyces sp. NPDC046866]|uniref:DUF4349 domain-containing protein n=1 Tax=Streptomyces sp. NPDC046866 TaxID=3154921 RepID=UPI003453CCD7
MLAGALVLGGCSAADDRTGASGPDRAAAAGPEAAADGRAGAAAAAPQAEGAAKGPQQQPAVRPHVVRTAALGIEAADARKVLAAARTAAEGAGGYVGSESTRRSADGSRDGGRITSTVVLRVPADRFDAVLGALEGGGRLLHRKVEAQDVTEKVADIDSRVKSQQASVARVREMMDRATVLGDVVMLEGELSKRQSELESLLAQQNALKDQTALGTITVEVSEPPAAPEAKEKDAGPSVSGALGKGWSAFTTVLRYLLLAVAVVLPFAVTAALGALVFRVLRRLRRPGPGAVESPPPARVPAARSADAAGAAPADPTESAEVSG